MDSNNKNAAPGLYLRGLVISNSARLITRKDGTGRSVIITHEIATQPGCVNYTRFMDENEPGLKINGEEITEFPKLPEMQPIQLKVRTETLRADRGKVEIRNAEVIK